MVVWYSWDHQWFEFRFIINHDLFSIYREYYHFQVFYYPLRDSPAAFSIPAERERQKRGQSEERGGAQNFDGLSEICGCLFKEYLPRNFRKLIKRVLCAFRSTVLERFSTNGPVLLLLNYILESK